MKNLVSLKMIVMVLLLTAVLGISTAVYATDVVVGGENISSESNMVSDQAGNTADNVIENVTVVENEDNEIEVEEKEPEEELPDAGKNDTILVVLIGLVSVSAIYTYAKLKGYNA